MSSRSSSSLLTSFSRFTRSSSSRSFSSSTSRFMDQKYVNPWKHRAHMIPSPSIPAPLPRLFPQQVVLADGSTFTSYTTAPTPSIIRLTRDVTNNPLWIPGTEKRGLSDDDEGRVGRFKRRFEGMETMATSSPSPATTTEDGDQTLVKAEDMSWMSQGGREEKSPAAKVKAGAKGGKKK